MLFSPANERLSLVDEPLLRTPAFRVGYRRAARIFDDVRGRHGIRSLSATAFESELPTELTADDVPDLLMRLIVELVPRTTPSSADRRHGFRHARHAVPSSARNRTPQRSARATSCARRSSNRRARPSPPCRDGMATGRPRAMRRGRSTQGSSISLTSRWRPDKEIYSDFEALKPVIPIPIWTAAVLLRALCDSFGPITAEARATPDIWRRGCSTDPDARADRSRMSSAAAASGEVFAAQIFRPRRVGWGNLGHPVSRMPHLTGSVTLRSFPRGISFGGGPQSQHARQDGVAGVMTGAAAAQHVEPPMRWTGASDGRAHDVTDRVICELLYATFDDAALSARGWDRVAMLLTQHLSSWLADPARSGSNPLGQGVILPIRMHGASTPKVLARCRSARTSRGLDAVRRFRHAAATADAAIAAGTTGRTPARRSTSGPSAAAVRTPGSSRKAEPCIHPPRPSRSRMPRRRRHPGERAEPRRPRGHLEASNADAERPPPCQGLARVQAPAGSVINHESARSSGAMVPRDGRPIGLRLSRLSLLRSHQGNGTSESDP